ncbi:esterase/lipase superfamily enzyme [Chitinophaga skermanii]|uniref:Esterase/lipase superfamily enzyme n=1 Tax=Chitinophaga skermanii TaxID=331697 RepID=A0A327QKR2_9BACT|nr:alpha/beta hydrolase-fold protein [Chitinophaga skermanii]RAJ05246.1 esterase/lipase superfamily enzyme [Chitinophaga skermanii]
MFIENYSKWHSNHLGRHFEMLKFGAQGYPVILFPTSLGRYYESKDRGLIESARWFVEQGKIQLYCVDSIDADSWYNRHIPAAKRAYNHACYDDLLFNDILPRIQSETGYERIAVAGCSFGGYHASNFAFKHPENVSYLFSMSGTFDIKPRVDDHYDDNVYFNNPIDYMPDNEHPDLWRMGIILGVAEEDISRGQNEYMSRVLDAKNIAHWLDIRPQTRHDWPVWKEMFPHYLSLIK